MFRRKGEKRRSGVYKLSFNIRGIILRLWTAKLMFRARRLSADPEEAQRQLKDYEIISFDLFDTLLFRPVMKPTDLFVFVGEKLGVADFKELRIEAEREARRQAIKSRHQSEVTIEEIYAVLAPRINIPLEQGVSTEIETELLVCYGNAKMREIWQKLLRDKKRIIVVTDMYLPRVVLTELLEKNGFGGFERLFISNEVAKSKADGKLYATVKKELGFGKGKLPEHTMIHIGDNVRSDYRNAKKNGIPALLYIPQRRMG